MNQRKIIHVDMDAFFASVEQRNDPSLKGRPVIVGGDPRKRGVVAACSYEARRYGIRSAMASSLAARLCPHAVFLRGNFDEYAAVSRRIRELFLGRTDLVEPMSLDEAYLDVTRQCQDGTTATSIAREIRSEIRETTGLSASAGVSYNKFLAKMASDHRKPDGLTVIPPDAALPFIDMLPVGKFFGIGKVTEQKLLRLGIRTGADLRRIPRDDLVRFFGKPGEYYHMICHGIDDRPVEPLRERKSVGREVTFPDDIRDMDAIVSLIAGIASSVAESIHAERFMGRTVTLKVRYDDFTTVTRCVTADLPCRDEETIYNHARALLRRTEAGARKIRLLGIGVSNCGVESEGQLLLPFGRDTEDPTS